LDLSTLVAEAEGKRSESTMLSTLAEVMTFVDLLIPAMARDASNI
jgi:hypothetical protein